MSNGSRRQYNKSCTSNPISTVDNTELLFVFHLDVHLDCQFDWIKNQHKNTFLDVYDSVSIKD